MFINGKIRFYLQGVGNEPKLLSFGSFGNFVFQNSAVKIEGQLYLLDLL